MKMCWLSKMPLAILIEIIHSLLNFCQLSTQLYSSLKLMLLHIYKMQYQICFNIPSINCCIFSNSVHWDMRISTRNWQTQISIYTLGIQTSRDCLKHWPKNGKQIDKTQFWPKLAIWNLGDPTLTSPKPLCYGLTLQKNFIMLRHVYFQEIAHNWYVITVLLVCMHNHLAVLVMIF